MYADKAQCHDVVSASYRQTLPEQMLRACQIILWAAACLTVATLPAMSFAANLLFATGPSPALHPPTSPCLEAALSAIQPAATCRNTAAALEAGLRLAAAEALTTNRGSDINVTIDAETFSLICCSAVKALKQSLVADTAGKEHPTADEVLHLQLQLHSLLVSGIKAISGAAASTGCKWDAEKFREFAAGCASLVDASLHLASFEIGDDDSCMPWVLLLSQSMLMSGKVLQAALLAANTPGSSSSSSRGIASSSGRSISICFADSLLEFQEALCYLGSAAAGLGPTYVTLLSGGCTRVECLFAANAHSACCCSMPGLHPPSWSRSCRYCSCPAMPQLL
jgi:hypothetical protein